MVGVANNSSLVEAQDSKAIQPNDHNSRLIYVGNGRSREGLSNNVMGQSQEEEKYA